MLTRTKTKQIIVNPSPRKSKEQKGWGKVSKEKGPTFTQKKKKKKEPALLTLGNQKKKKEEEKCPQKKKKKNPTFAQKTKNANVA